MVRKPALTEALGRRGTIEVRRVQGVDLGLCLLARGAWPEAREIYGVLLWRDSSDLCLAVKVIGVHSSKSSSVGRTLAA